MKKEQALGAFGALSQETRLQIIRMLVAAGPDGLAAGSIAEKAKVSPSNLSFHLKELERVGLVTAQRESRSIVYRANYDALGGLIRFLTEDCCAGHLEICAPLAIPTLCCEPDRKQKSR